MAEAFCEPIPQVLGEIERGDGLSLSAAGRLFPGHRGGKSVDPSTPFRWVTKGAKAADGRVVKLEAVRVGGRWLTSRPAIARFVAALTSAAASDDQPAPPPNAPGTRRVAVRRAEEQLEKQGA